MNSYWRRASVHGTLTRGGPETGCNPRIRWSHGPFGKPCDFLILSQSVICTFFFFTVQSAGILTDSLPKKRGFVSLCERGKLECHWMLAWTYGLLVLIVAALFWDSNSRSLFVLTFKNHSVGATNTSCIWNESNLWLKSFLKSYNIRVRQYVSGLTFN